MLYLAPVLALRSDAKRLYREISFHDLHARRRSCGPLEKDASVSHVGIRLAVQQGYCLITSQSAGKQKMQGRT